MYLFGGKRRLREVLVNDYARNETPDKRVQRDIEWGAAE